MPLRVLSGGTADRIGVWQDSYTLWRDAVAKAPNVHLTHDCYGGVLMQRGEVDEAISQFKIALSLEPKGAAESLAAGGARLHLENV